MILYWIVIAIHVIASLMLIVVILFQAGRGGGLSETFGGASTQTILGTKSSIFLKRATAVSAVVYILTCLTLAVLTSHQGRSLVSRGLELPAANQAEPLTPQASQQPVADTTEPVTEPVAVPAQ